MSSNGYNMLSRWERRILLDKLHGLQVDPKHLRIVKHKVKKRLLKAFKDIQLILAVFPDLDVTGVSGLRGVGFEPTNPYGTGASVLRL